MKVERTHHTDASEPDEDGRHEWRYEYDLYRFVEGDTVLLARSYTDTPHEAHFLRVERAGEAALIEGADAEAALFRQATEYLAAEGKTEISRLGGRGYERVSKTA